MVSIPERRWVSLSQAAELVAALTKVSVQKAAEAVVGAGIDGQIDAQGIGTDGSIIDPRLHQLDPHEWRADASRWREDCVGEIEQVEIKRLSIFAWLGLATDGLTKMPFAQQGTAESPKLEAADHWLSHDRLELKIIINVARGATPMDWPPPLGGEWHARFRALKAAIDSGELPATLRATSANKAAVVLLTDLWNFARAHPANEWDWLRQFCQRWSRVRGDTAETPDIARTGAPGRPTMIRVIEQELEARAARGDLQPTLVAESETLREWAAAKYKDAPIPTAKTIQNRLRDGYRRLANRQYPK